MKITYFLDWNGSPESGVPSKVLDQVCEWARQGVSVKLLVSCPNNHVSEWVKMGAICMPYVGNFGRFVNRFLRAPLKIASTNSDVLYFRYGLFTPLELLLFVYKFSVLEINAQNDAYYKLRSRIHFLLYTFQRFLLSRSVDLFVHVTAESLKKSAYPKKSVFVTNGIDLTKYPNLKTIRTRNPKPLAIFVGSDNFEWNGASKLEKIAQQVDMMEIYSVGISHQVESLIKTVSPTYGSDFETFLGKMDFGISTLDIQRMGIEEAAPLKTRHYLAAGLPVIAGCRDSAFPEGAPFYFLVEFDPENYEIINIEKLKEFIVQWSGKRVEHSLLSSIDIKHTESRRIAYIKEFTNCDFRT